MTPNEELLLQHTIELLSDTSLDWDVSTYRDSYDRVTEYASVKIPRNGGIYMCKIEHTVHYKSFHIHFTEVDPSQNYYLGETATIRVGETEELDTPFRNLVDNFHKMQRVRRTTAEDERRTTFIDKFNLRSSE